MRAVFAVFPLLMLGTVAALAAGEPDVDCADPQTQPEMTYCAGIEYEDADGELNAIWPEVIAEAKAWDADLGDYLKGSGIPSTVDALRAAQRAWITYRDAQCELESYEVLGGTAQPMVGSLCLARITRERTEMLKSQFLDTR